MWPGLHSENFVSNNYNRNSSGTLSLEKLSFSKNGLQYFPRSCSQLFLQSHLLPSILPIVYSAPAVQAFLLFPVLVSLPIAFLSMYLNDMTCNYFLTFTPYHFLMSEVFSDETTILSRTLSCRC